METRIHCFHHYGVNFVLFVFSGNSGSLFIIVRRMCRYTVELWTRTTRTAASQLTKEIRTRSKWQMLCSTFIGHQFEKLLASDWETWTRAFNCGRTKRGHCCWITRSLDKVGKRLLFERLKHLYWCACSFRSTRLVCELYVINLPTSCLHVKMATTCLSFLLGLVGIWMFFHICLVRFWSTWDLFKVREKSKLVRCTVVFFDSSSSF